MSETDHMDTPHRVDLWQRAIAIAARAHEHQYRKDGCTPYIAHAMRVAFTVRDLFACDDETVLVAAVLHDTIEDTELDFDDLEANFGSDIADVVAALSKDQRLREPEREAAYDAQLAAGPWQAKLIKLADTYDNFCDQATAVTKPVTLTAAVRRMERALAIAGDDPRLVAGVRFVRGVVERAKERIEASGGQE
jgi:(p)ppGpp synthase/HD superfamily hydrolase